jgi:hypothetical protein
MREKEIERRVAWKEMKLQELMIEIIFAGNEQHCNRCLKIRKRNDVETRDSEKGKQDTPRFSLCVSDRNQYPRGIENCLQRKALTTNIEIAICVENEQKNFRDSLPLSDRMWSCWVELHDSSRLQVQDEQNTRSVNWIDLQEWCWWLDGNVECHRKSVWRSCEQIPFVKRIKRCTYRRLSMKFQGRSRMKQ